MGKIDDTNSEIPLAAPDEHRLIRQRVQGIADLRSRGVNPFPARWRRTHGLTEARVLLEEVEAASAEEKEHVRTDSVRVAGRITAKREMGRMTFMDLKSDGTTLQAQLRSDILGDAPMELASFLDLGDFTGVAGPVFRTRRGEPTVEVSELVVLGKSLRPLPDKWSGLKDPETRRRQRYLDLIANDSAMADARIRAEMVASIREFMRSRGFMEVETPILVPIAAGAHAKPFKTHHNALGQDFYLRIATELPLKKLIVGGMEKVFELGRVFRNEGMDHDHNPEFTTVEAYQAYASYEDMMELLESLVCHAAVTVKGSPLITNQSGAEIDLTPPWKRIKLIEEVIKRTGIDLRRELTESELIAEMRAAGIHPEGSTSLQSLMDKIISANVEPHLIEPCFLTDYPVVMSPLAKRLEHEAAVAERFEAFMFGMEIANSFTELNDPIDQRERLEEQERIRIQQGDDETDRLDEDFLTALEYGMPPTGGIGIGVDRLARLLAGTGTIRDVLLFPAMRS